MKTKRLSCSAAREISIVSFLEGNNINPVKQDERDTWFLSPFRDEKTASFKVDNYRNKFYDFGIMKGGDIIDLVMIIENCSVVGALDILSGSNSFSFQRQEYMPKPKEAMTLQSASEVTSFALLSYFRSRMIDVDIAKKYCKELSYSFKGRNYYAIGFPSKDGWELRNQKFKGCIGKKSISHLQKGNQNLAVFEGFFDFLSYQTFMKDSPGTDFLILNSVALLERSISILKEYKSIELFLDNDPAGDNGTALILSQNSKAIDCRNLYRSFKDYNQFLMSSKTRKYERI